jgi:arginyl-tRNA synthetase
MARPDELDPVLAVLGARIRAALVAADLPDVDPALEKPKLAEHGDWATTAALRLAKPAKRDPRELAQRLVDHLEVPAEVEEVSIAGPGFVNFRLAHRYHEDLVRRVVAEGGAYGRRVRPADQREHVNVEFVSANPTGPLHVGAGRWAATGDAIAALLEADGHAVVREYYVNDAGEQIRRFGESIALVARGDALTEEHYRGAVVKELADELRADRGDALLEGDLEAVAEQVGELGVEAMRARIEAVLHHMGVDFDVWYSERHGLHETGAIAATIDELEARGETERADGAVFLRTEAHGDDKDRVLVRSDGRPTYFAADCAYMRDKWSACRRGLRPALLPARRRPPRLRRRLKAAADCLGIPPERIEIRIGQIVNLLRSGEPVRMSQAIRRTIELDEVVEEVGVDVTRYHFLRQGLDTTSTLTWPRSRSSRWKTPSTTSSTRTPG